MNVTSILELLSMTFDSLFSLSSEAGRSKLRVGNQLEPLFIYTAL